MSYAFLSHSSEDKELVEKLAARLGNENVFFDKWDLSAGRLVPSDIAKGVFGSSWFVIIASRASMSSRWVKYEINLALIKWIEDENYRILLARIDDCDVPIELKPFLYIDSPNQPLKAMEELVRIILSEGKGIALRNNDWLRSFSIVDRHSELEAIEFAALEGNKFIFITGIYGIGKSALAEHASYQLFRNRLARFPLTRGHDIQRLTLEMASRAKISLPSQEANEDNLLSICNEAIYELNKNGFIIFFDDIELALDDDGCINDYLSKILNNILSIQNVPPIFISSTRELNLNIEIRIVSHVIRVGPLKDKYIFSCLKRWIKTANPGEDLPREDLLNLVVNELHGYPLATRFAAYIVVKYSLEEALTNLTHFQNIRIDMVKQLIGRSRQKLSDLQMSILIFLTFADTGLTQDDLRQLLGVDINDLRPAVNELVSYMFISIEEGRLQILSLMKDFFWRYAQSKGIWKNVAELMAFYARDTLPAYDRNSEDFIHYCAMAYRLFLLSNRDEEAKNLAYYFKGEMREACIKLYHAKRYSSSLNYANKWLSMMPNDSEIRLFKARCLIRLENYDEAEAELAELRKLRFGQEKVAHVTGLLYKNKGDVDKSIIYFKRGLDIRPDYLPLLRDYADALERKGELKEAYKIIKQADELSPRDLYIGPKYVSILKKMGQLNEALHKMEDLLIAFPDVASFHHSASMLYSDLGSFEDSYKHAKIAVSLDCRLYEAVTHLASLELRTNRNNEANQLLDSLPLDINYSTRLIRDTIRAEMLLREDHLQEARALLKDRYLSDPYCADVYARIELRDAKMLAENGDSDIAKDRLLRGIEIIESALKRFPNNFSLNSTLNHLEIINKQITC